MYVLNKDSIHMLGKYKSPINDTQFLALSSVEKQMYVFYNPEQSKGLADVENNHPSVNATPHILMGDNNN